MPPAESLLSVVGCSGRPRLARRDLGGGRSYETDGQPVSPRLQVNTDVISGANAPRIKASRVFQGAKTKYL